VTALRANRDRLAEKPDVPVPGAREDAVPEQDLIAVGGGIDGCLDRRLVAGDVDGGGERGRGE
jgi:hypothetical protein